MYCSKCGHEEDSGICSLCGGMMIDWYCEYCGAEIDHYCTKCPACEAPVNCPRPEIVVYAEKRQAKREKESNATGIRLFWYKARDRTVAFKRWFDSSPFRGLLRFVISVAVIILTIGGGQSSSDDYNE